MKFAVLGLLLPLAAGRKITLVNSCRQTVWPGMFAEPGPMPNHETGWEMEPGASSEIEVSENWTAGRIWARTGCVMQDGKFSCLTGNCGLGEGGSVLCTTTGEIATLAEFTLGDPYGNDHFDVSLVDGFNMPMSITPSAEACKNTVPACKANINEVCPPLLRAGIDENGANAMCMSSCKVGFGETPAGNRACCTGAYEHQTKECEPCGVDYYNVFKEQCPDAYAHAYDEYSETALWQCQSVHKSDYTIEFCPDSQSFIGATKASEQYVDATATCEFKIPGGELQPRPSPTEPKPKSNLKVTLYDGPVPSGGGAPVPVPTAQHPSSQAAGGGASQPAGGGAAPSNAAALPPPAAAPPQADAPPPAGAPSSADGPPPADAPPPSPPPSAPQAPPAPSAQPQPQPAGDQPGREGGGGDDRDNGGNGGNSGDSGNRGNGGDRGDNRGGAPSAAPINYAASDPLTSSSPASPSLSGQVGNGPGSGAADHAASGSAGSGGRRQCPARRRRRSMSPH